MASPCMGCEKREIGCHAECAEYSAWRESRRPELKEKQRIRDADKWLCRSVQRQIWQSMRGK